MAKKLTAVSVKALDGVTYYVPMSEFNTFDIPEKADSVIGGWIQGKGGPLLRVSLAADFTWAYT